jgi:hypothetical protein
MIENVASASIVGLIPNFAIVQSFDDIQNRFIESGRSILLEHDLVRESDRWQITALELYLFHPELWPDDSTDRDKEGIQLQSGRWYVRKAGLRTQWRIDITAGIRAKTIYAGMLIAAVGKEDGSGNALNTIFHGDRRPRDWDYYADEEIIRKIHNSCVYEESSCLRLEKRPAPRLGNIFIGKRKRPRMVKKLKRPQRWQLSKLPR